MGEIKINLIPDIKPIKKRPYQLARQYKPMVHKEIEAVFYDVIIYPIETLKEDIPMVFQLKKHDLTRLRICVNYRRLNTLTVMDPFLTPFTDEIINETTGHEYHSFTDGFSRYN